MENSDSDNNNNAAIDVHNNNTPLSNLDRELITHFQHNFPLTENPYAAMAAELGVNEAEVIGALKAMRDSGVITRVGPVFNHRRVGASLLAAMAVPEDELEATADKINSYVEVNHNYAREHHFNLWFVVTAPNQQHLQRILQHMENRCGRKILKLPMEKAYHIDLGFKPDWQS